MKNSTISKQRSYLTDLFSTLAVKSHRRSTLWLMLLTLLLLPTRMVAQGTTEDQRCVLFNGLDGITGVTITDKGSYPWQKLDLNAEGMENVSSYFTNESKGLMSSNCKKSYTTSETVIEFNVEKSILFSFKYLVSSEQKYDVFTITLDGKKLEGISGTSQYEYKKILSVGKHSLTLSYKKDQSTNKGADRAFIYDLKTSTTIDGYVAEYDATNYTLTFKKITSINSEAIDLNRIVMVNNKQTVINLCSLLGIKIGNIKNIKNVIFEESFNTYTPTSLKEFFRDCTGLNEITGLKYLNTAEVTDMSYMFWNCRNLSSLDLTNFNTTKVENMFGMFYDCENLSSLVISNFNTANVTDMSNMFYLCKNLSSLDIPNFNTANVTDMSYMFDTCQKLTELNLSNFKTEKVKNMRYMFSYCNKLKKLNLSNFNTANVTNMTCMFINCKELSSLDISNFNTAKVKDMSSMFKNCQVLSSLDLSNFNTTKVTDMSGMFSGCSMLQTIYVSDDFVVTGITNDSYKKDLFTGCEALKGALPKYEDTMTSSDYANYKTGYFSKLVGKNGEEKIGAAGEPLAAYNLALDDNKDFVAYEPFAAKAASYSRTINTTWATLCLPFEVSLDGKNFRAFKLLSANEGTNTVELEELKTPIPAGTPVIIKMNEGETQLNFSVADKAIANEVKTSATDDGNYQFKGLYTQKEFSKDVDNNCYIVKGDKLMNPAKLLENKNVKKVVSKPFRAYMVDNSSAPTAGAKMFSIGFDNDSTTAIDSLNTIANDKAEYFDLQGKRLNEPQKGINIVKRNGKTMKVIIK